MRSSDVMRAWNSILRGTPPVLSIEVTRECPLRCPGCYAYEDNHVVGLGTLRNVSDRKGSALVSGVLEIIDRVRPLHVSLVGGDPLVRHREMEELVPQILDRGAHVQVVTSAFRPIPRSWATLDRLTVAVSIDGLRPEHDVRRTPATYDRILANIAGQRITIHCTVTSQMVRRAGYLREFLDFWTVRPEIRKVWFSLFTPQRGAQLEEILTPEQRIHVVEELGRMRPLFPKLDMRDGLLRQFLNPPKGPESCLFAQLTETLSADLKTKITPCQFGGDPDCSQCGCVASMALSAVGKHKIGGIIPIGGIFQASYRLGSWIGKRTNGHSGNGDSVVKAMGQSAGGD